MKAGHVMRTMAAGLLVASLVAGCKEEGGGSSPDRVKIQAFLLDNTPTGTWRSVRMRVEWDGADTAPETCELYQSGLQVALPSIPYDTEFSVALRFYTTADCTGDVVAVGRSTPKEVAGDSSTQELIYVPIAPTNQFVRTSRVVPDPQTGALSTQPSEPAQGRYGASVTPLPDGRVVIIGGCRLADTGTGLFDNPGEDRRPWDILENVEEVYDTVEIYDSSTGAFEALDTNQASPQTLFYRRAFHRAVYLAGLNLIAVVGGYQQLQVGGTIEPSVYIELFDPVSKQFYTPESVGPLKVPRVGHSADVLSYQTGEGLVEYLLVAGGKSDGARTTYEILRIEGGDNSAAFGEFPNGRWGHETVLTTRTDGQRQIFFVAGEQSSGPTPVIDIFTLDTTTPAFVKVEGSTAPTGLASGGRVGHTALYVPKGTPVLLEGVYVIGGFTDKDHTQVANRIEVLNATNGAALTKPEDNFNLNLRRALHSTALLSTGHIVVTGGVFYEGDRLRMVQGNEVIGPVVVSGASGPQVQIRAIQTSALISNRFHHASVGLPNGQGLVLGGLVKLDDNVRLVGVEQADQGSELIAFDQAF